MFGIRDGILLGRVGINLIAAIHVFYSLRSSRSNIYGRSMSQTMKLASYGPPVIALFVAARPNVAWNDERGEPENLNFDRFQTPLCRMRKL